VLVPSLPSFSASLQLLGSGRLRGLHSGSSSAPSLSPSTLLGINYSGWWLTRMQKGTGGRERKQVDSVFLHVCMSNLEWPANDSQDWLFKGNTMPSPILGPLHLHL
jgi:hypothetical protein